MTTQPNQIPPEKPAPPPPQNAKCPVCGVALVKDGLCLSCGNRTH